MCDTELILASGSPRRHLILLEAGIPHRVCPTDADETLPEGISPALAVMTLAERKARAAAAHRGDGSVLILAADTLVTMNGEIYGKPRDREDAYRMLSSFAGGVHSVITGVCVTDGVRYESSAEETLVFMREVSDREIYAYIDKWSPYDKAGAYGIQEAAGLFVRRIEGDYQNIVGLPLCLTGELLSLFGYAAI